MNTPLLAFHGDPAIKERYLARVRTHRAADDIIRGTYGRAEGASGWRGCAVGCTLHGENHAAYEGELGIPRALAHLEDTLFERMPLESAPDWPVEFLEAIPIGADLSLVVWQLLSRGIRDLLRFATEATRPAMERVLSEVLEPKARGEEINADAAADAAAYAAYAAGDAADAAGDAAAYAADAAYATDAAAYAAARAAASAAYAASAAADAADAAYAAAYAAARAADAAASAAYAAASADIAYQWSRWLLELMAAAPVPAQQGAIR